MNQNTPPWAKKRRKKSIIMDHKTGEKYTLSEPRYGRKQKKECLGGCRLSGIPRFHDSSEEALYCNKLRILLKCGEIKGFEAQKKYDLYWLDGTPCGYHLVDFVVYTNDGKIEIHEYKGLLDRESRLRAALFSHCYPEYTYLIKRKSDLI